MGKVQLIINNQVADVYDAESVMTAITYSIADINDIDKRGNSTTKTIKLPATARNKAIFGYLDDVTVTSYRGQKVALTGSIRESGTEVLVGVTNVKLYQRTKVDGYFEITIIGNGAEWIEHMANADLRGIGTDGYHYKGTTAITNAQAGTLPYAYALIQNGFAGGVVKIASIEDDGQGMALAIIDGTNTLYNLRTNVAGGQYVNGAGFDKSFYNKRMAITGDVMTAEQQALKLNTPFMGSSSGVLRAETSDVRVEDMALVINVEKLFTKLFTLAGYRISSTFCSSNFFKSLFMLPGKEKRSEAWVNANKVTAGRLTDYQANSITSTGNFPFNKIVSGNVGLFSTSNYRFTASEGMLVKFKATFNIKGTEGYFASVRFLVNGNVTYGAQSNYVTQPMELKAATSSLLVQEAEFRLNAGDYVTAQVMLPTMGGVAGDVYIYAAETTLECTATDAVIKGTYIIPYDYLPEAKRIDFVKAIRHLFNLYFFTDVNTKTVYIEPRDTFYRRDKSIDLTEKLDMSKAVTIEELGADINKRLAFQYKDDSADFGLTEYERLNGKRYSSHTETLLNRFSAPDTKAIENPMFAPTIMGTYNLVGLGVSLLPKIMGEPQDADPVPEKIDEYVPRILHYAGMRDCKAGESWRFEGVVQTQYPAFGSYDVDSVNDNSLLFDPQANIPDLFFKHYQNYINTINDARRITAFFNINAQDIQALTVPDPAGNLVKDFRALVYARFGGEVVPCRLESINDYIAGKPQSTKVVLITDVDNISQQVTPFIESMEFTNDLLTMGTAYANGTVIRYGTIWSEVRGGNLGSIIAQVINYGIGASGGGSYRIERTFLFFDTSNIPDAATITEAYIDLYKIAGDVQQEVGVFQGTQANIITTSDYQAFNPTLFGQSAPGNLGARRIQLNAAGIAAINKYGWTKYCIRDLNFDIANVAPGYAMSSFKTYLANSPAIYLNKLTVKYIV